MKELDKKLSSRGRWVYSVATKRTARGHYRTAIITDGYGGQRRYEARAMRPEEAMTACFKQVFEQETSDD